MIRQRQPIARRTPLPRATKPLPKFRARPRRGPERAREYMTWLRGRRCVVCAKFPELRLDFDWRYRVIDPAHTQNNGLSSKGPDTKCAPLCRCHHTEYDAGRERFEHKYEVDMQIEATAHHALFLLTGGVE